MTDPGELARLVEAVAAGAKYRQLDPHLIASIGAAELGKGRGWKDAVKATKNKLHQIAAAYHADRPDYGRRLEDLARLTDPAAQQAWCHATLGLHASTRERRAGVERFYTAVLAGLPAPDTILDLACGLNPLARGWMPGGVEAEYLAFDVYQDEVDFLNGAFGLLGWSGRAQVWDLLQGAPPVHGDVALLLKTLPCLEQADRSIGRRLLDTVQAPVLIISYPVASLGGRSKGMREGYTARFEELVAGHPGQVSCFELPDELVFRLVR